MPVAVPKDNLEQCLFERNVAILTNSLHFETLSIYDLSGTLLHPCNILSNLTDQLQYLVWVAIKKVLDNWTESSRGGSIERSIRVWEQLLVELCLACSDRFDGAHMLSVDPRRAFTLQSLVRSALRLHDLCCRQGILERNIVISLPASNEGIRATRLLTERRIKVNLYFVSGLMHAAACAEAGASTITIPVGAVLRAHEDLRGSTRNSLKEHSGIKEIQTILLYFRHNRIKTKVIGIDFRDLAEIGALSEFDAVCLSKEQLDRLKWTQVPLLSLDQLEPDIGMRARQAKYPTEFLTCQKPIMVQLSSISRRMTDHILQEEIHRTQDSMQTVVDMISAATEQRYRTSTRDLKTLYEEVINVTTLPLRVKRKKRLDNNSTNAGGDSPEKRISPTNISDRDHMPAEFGLDEVF